MPHHRPHTVPRLRPPPGSRRVLPSSYYINKAEALFQFPMLRSDGLKGAVVYYDGAFILASVDVCCLVLPRAASCCLLKDGNSFETASATPSGKCGYSHSKDEKQATILKQIRTDDCGTYLRLQHS